MTVVSDNYAKVLFDMNYDAEAVDQMRALLSNKELSTSLESPFVRKKAKHAIIGQLFPASVCNFVKVMSDNGDIALADDMFDTFDALQREKRGAIKATFTYVTKPDGAQISKLKEKICSMYGKKEVELDMKEDPALVGGFVLQVGDTLLDKSIRTSILRMQRHFAVR
ncbi:MAG: ATP synthase F1 subunit delta [Oscillospiraceae bacterium]|nr:ATP synthase F1 subunit delta [Oscillospiraceae bacterium]